MGKKKGPKKAVDQQHKTQAGNNMDSEHQEIFSKPSVRAKLERLRLSPLTPLDPGSISSPDHLDEKEILLRNGFDIDADGFDGPGAMCWAAEAGDMAILRLLLRNGIEASVPSKSRTPLHYAVRCRDLEPARLLIKAGADLHARDDQASNPLHQAAAHRRAHLVEFLLEHGADPNPQDANGKTPLMTASELSHVRTVQILLEYKADVATEDKQGETALSIASHWNQLETVKLLLEADANVNARNGKDETPIVRAVQGTVDDSSAEMVQLLLTAGADSTFKDGSGNSLLALAALNDRPDLVQLLVDAGLDIHARNKAGQTPLAIAAAGGCESIVELFVDESFVQRLGGDVGLETKDNSGYTPLAVAAQSGRGNIVLDLVNNDADVKTRGADGRTPLALAADKGHAQIVEILMTVHAEISCKDNSGYTPLALAAKNGHIDTVELLVDGGADIAVEDCNGQTALDLATKNEHNQMVRFLSAEKAKSAVYTAINPSAPHAASSGLYTPLVNSRQTRILVLLPGNFSDPVECQLESVPYKSIWAQYEALSYIWGSDDPSEEIWISNQRRLVRKNLHSALLCFRNSSKPRRLWVDAICIDQENLTERASQVQNMTGIYSRAEKVLLWLGDDDQLGRYLNHITKLTAQLDQSINSGDFQGYTPPEGWDPLLFRNRYFTRAWIYQEVACAAKATIYSGTIDTDGAATYALEWDKLESLYTMLGELRPLLNDGSSVFGYVGPLVRGRFWRQNVGDRKEHGFPLLSLLELRRDSQATMPADQIYALLGLSQEGLTGAITPNYTLSAAAVYTEITNFFIHEYRDLSVLSAVQHTVQSDLPTWVPDWRNAWKAWPILYHMTDRKELRRTGHGAGRGLTAKWNALGFKTQSPRWIESIKRSYDASAGKPVTLRSDSTSTELSLEGKPFTTIKVVLDFIVDILEYGTHNAAKITHLEEAGINFSVSYPGSERTYLDALRSVLVADLNDPSDATEIPEHTSYGDGYNSFIKLVERRTLFRGATTERRLFLSENGYLGLAPAGVAPGDEVCILFGGKVPYVVRECGGHYKFIGECYCEGIMNGEALEDGNCSDGHSYIFH